MSNWTKDKDAHLDYAFNWQPWLAEGETISNHVITVQTHEGDVTPLTKSTSAVDGGVVTYWLAAGSAGKTYKVACRVTTSQGRIDERTDTIDVRDR